MSFCQYSSDCLQGKLKFKMTGTTRTAILMKKWLMTDNTDGKTPYIYSYMHLFKKKVQSLGTSCLLLATRKKLSFFPHWDCTKLYLNCTGQTRVKLPARANYSAVSFSLSAKKRIQCLARAKNKSSIAITNKKRESDRNSTGKLIENIQIGKARWKN